MRRTPVTRREIVSALEARGLRPLNRFGQNFLVQPQVLDRIVAEAGIQRGDVVLEPGPGTGGLTERLLEAGARVIAVEVDRGLHGLLGDILGSASGLRLIQADVMARKSRLSPEVLEAVSESGGLGEAGWKVVANLPFQISSPFLSALVQLPLPPHLCVVTLQKEVGRVLLAAPGDPDYSPLSFLARLYWTVRRVMELAPAAFHPRPKVASVVMRLEQAPPRPVPPAVLLPFARRLFQGRRKALRRTLPAALDDLEGAVSRMPDALLEAAGISPDARIDAISPVVIEALAQLARGARSG